MYRVASGGDLAVKVKRKVPSHFRSAAGGHENMPMVLLFDATDEHGESVRFCVDNHDKAHFVHEALLDGVDLYFKLNYDPDELLRAGIPQALLHKIHPVRSPIAPVGLRAWAHRPSLLTDAQVRWGYREVGRRVRQLSRHSTLEQLQALRTTPKSVDVVFVVRIYDEPQHRHIDEQRYELARRLDEHSDINAMVGLIGKPAARYRHLAVDEVKTSHHLKQLSASRVGLYIPGPHQCLSFKMAELLALGLPIAGYRIPRDRANLAAYPMFDEQFAYDDPADLVDGVAKALQDQHRLEELSRNNLELFDEFLAPEPTARRLLETVFATRRTSAA